MRLKAISRAFGVCEPQNIGIGERLEDFSFRNYRSKLKSKYRNL